MRIEEFHVACRMGDVCRMKVKLEEDPGLVNRVDGELGWNPLFRCIICQQEKAVEFVLKNGADLAFRSTLGETALHLAAEGGLVRTLQLLLDYGSDPDTQRNDGETALHTAVKQGNAQIVKLLLSYHATPYIRDNEGRIPRDYAESCEIICLFPEDSLFDLSDDESLPVFKLTERSFFITNESLIEPECEKHDQSGISHLSGSCDNEQSKGSLYRWLSGNRLDNLYEPLVKNGFDDIGMMKEQMDSCNPITESMLEQVGISKPGHRLRLIALLETEREAPGNLSCCMRIPRPSGTFIRSETEDWLDSIGLGYLAEKFEQAGYSDYEHLVLLMTNKCYISDERLKNDIGIEKIGHRQRILSCLREEVKLRERESGRNWDACGMCMVM